MELFKEILINILQSEKIEVTFPNLTESVKSIVEQQSHMALEKIKAIIHNDNLSDFDCIEEIVCVFEEIGSDGGGRHDF